MKRKLLIVGGVALAAAILTTAFFYALLSDKIGRADEGPLRPVVVAAEDLPRGTQLELKRLTINQRPVDEIPDDAFARLADVEGKFIVNSVSAGRPITKRLLPGPGVNGLAAAIPAGMRAVTLHVAEYVGVNDIVRPGDRVDVLAASDTARNSLRRTTIETVLEDIEVLATDRERAIKDRRLSPTVTILVDEELVEAVSLADEDRVIRLALRNPTEDTQLTEGEAAQAASNDSADPARAQAAVTGR